MNVSDVFIANKPYFNPVFVPPPPPPVFFFFSFGRRQKGCQATFNVFFFFVVAETGTFVAPNVIACCRITTSSKNIGSGAKVRDCFLCL